MKMMILWVVIAVGATFTLWFFHKMDRRWYKRHPGAEEKFAEIDRQLTRQGK